MIHGFQGVLKNVSKIVMMFMLFMTSSLYANNEQMNESLVKIIHELDAIMPLMDEAQQEQDKNTLAQFHFDDFKDVNGVKHEGLREDILSIRQSLINEVNNAPLEP